MKDIKHIRWDFHSVAWVMSQASDLAGTVGGWRSNVFLPKFNQICRANYLHQWHRQRHNIFWSPPTGALGRGQKVKHNKILITKSISKIFKPNFVCPLINERYKTYQTGFFIPSPRSCPRVGLRGTKADGGQKTFFPKSTRFGV